ncbi:class I tRNA ligase family protein [Mycoplasma phocimorsus]|uniref:class I tRNA ligase family protein n=1 Tax=Mycoplasma phocimorsus TaxID=3045839 RepID=UPI0024C089F3|nr:class I tRNA ligase family protein [Mycoplasma phocimorsus]MDJ1647081.1 class I tRNA ligase family protein [Mycoplasma phocimorsus]
MKKIYVCGPTVYSDIHIGNLRPIISIDFVLKAYRYLNIDFNFIHNITDIDDKIIKKAQQEGKSEMEISSFYFSKYLELLNLLNIDTITKIENVTQNMNILIHFIEKLVLNNSAYITKNGVIYDVGSNKEYGKLSNLNMSNTISNAFDENKKNEQDFYLWKFTTTGVKFNSPWGSGRPGWHTECVAIIDKNFKGQTIDIHSGGIDLIFPHHENENAQFYSLYKKPLADIWKYVGTIKHNGIKMSKSLGNVILAKDFITKYGSDVLRLLVLNHRFNSEVDINQDTILNLQKILIKYRKNYLKSMLITSNDINENAVKEIMKALYDFDYHRAIFFIELIIKNINKNVEVDLNLNTLKKVFEVFKFSFIDEFSLNNILEKYYNWKEELKKKNYKKADLLRENLLKEGWI